MAVSDKAREHMARIAAAMQRAREQRLDEALARDPIERIEEGLALGVTGPLDIEVEMRLEARAVAQAELALRGRRLGRRRSS